MIKNLKRELKSILLPISEISFNLMPKDKIFPHIVGDLTVAQYKEGLYTFVFDIDVWDRNETTENVDNLTEKIIESLDRLKHISSDFLFTCYLTNIINVQSEDRTLKRNTIKFEIQLRKGENKNGTM